MTESIGRLRWGVKESFIDYVRGLSDGTIETFAGCEADEGVFVFSGESAREGILSFSGGIRFTGFAGMLDVRLVDPMIEGDGVGKTLTALVGPRPIAARVAIPAIEGGEPLRAGEAWTAQPKLTFEGVRIFGDVYEVGTELAPLVYE